MSLRSPASLAVGGFVGAAPPLLSYFTVHLGHLLDGAEVLWRSPLWILVGGSLALSSKSVFRWGLHTFGDWGSALALVAMLEGALLLAPHPLISKAALGLLVAINATVYGCALAIQDLEDRRAEKAEAEAAAAAAAAAVKTPAIEPSATKAAPPTKTKATAAAAAAPTAAAYEAALAYVADKATTSTEAVRTGLRVRHPKAAALVEQLEVQGVVGKPNPLDRGRRPVLLAAAKNVG